MLTERRSSSAGQAPSGAMKVAAVLGAKSGLGFGIPCAVGMQHLARTGEVWTFRGFPTYGKGPFERIGLPTTVPLLSAFLAVCASEVATAWSLWRHPRTGARLSHAVLSVEAVFWAGFALPFGPPLALARTAAILMAGRREDPDAAPRA
jgi:hypothetical protein